MTFFILAFCEYNINTSDISCSAHGCFTTRKEARLYAEKKIQDDKNKYIEEYGNEEYVDENFVFDFSIREFTI